MCLQMKQVFLSRNGIETKEVPEPQVERGKILIKNLYSCVSPGTEISSLNSIKKNSKFDAKTCQVKDVGNMSKNVFVLFCKK